MKKNIVFSIAVAAICFIATQSFALNITNDFVTLDDGNGWGGNWTQYDGDGSSFTADGVGHETGGGTGQAAWGRVFSSSINNITGGNKLSFVLGLHNDNTDLATNCGMNFYDVDGVNVAITIGFANDAGTIKYGVKENGTFTFLGAAGLNTNYTFEISSVDFGNENFWLTVNGVGGATRQFNNLAGTYSAFDSIGVGGTIPAGVEMQVDTINFNGSAVPEPSSVAFFGIGLLGLVGAGWKRMKSRA